MSRIWAALPLPNPLEQWHPLGVCWWRTPLPKNDDGHNLIVHQDSIRDDEPARLGCWEWFDGLDAQLIHGVDVFGVAMEFDRGRQYLDVLALPLELFGRTHWWPITAPDEPDAHRHPTGDGFPIPIQIPSLPFRYAPSVRDVGFPG